VCRYMCCGAVPEQGINVEVPVLNSDSPRWWRVENLRLSARLCVGGFYHCTSPRSQYDEY
jgi:hypothetical protein